MTIDEIKDKLEQAFSKYEFVENGHYYLCNGKKVGISTTGLIHQYSQEFDSEAIAERVALKNYKNNLDCGSYLPDTKEAVLEEWRIENLHSTIKGSMIHEYAQSLWQQKEYTFDYSEVPQEIDLVRLKSDLEILKKQAENFYDDYKDMYSLIGCEMYLGDEDYDECGATDQLMFNNYTEELAIWDYKSNKEIVYNTKYNQKMKVPLQKYDDVNYVHYSLQLYDYAYKITKNTGFEVKEKMLIHFDTNKDNYTIIEPLNMLKEAKEILEIRRVKDMKSIPVLIYGKSGSGKTASFRNYKNDDIAYINILDKPLPFKSNIKINSLDSYEKIIAGIKSTKKKLVVIDDAGFLLTNEMFERAKEVGYTKFTQIAEKFYNLIKEIKKIEGGKIVVISMHEEIEDGVVKLKTAGRMIESNGVIEGNFTIAIRTMCDNGKYIFRVKNTGDDITKTPIGMFEENEIDNDFKIVEKAVREYYELDNVVEEKEEKEEESK